MLGLRRIVEALCAIALMSVPLPGYAADRATEPQVLIVGTYHLSNPGADLHNVKADDVLKPARQAQVQAISDALARFEPTFVGVEWPAQVVEERYPKYVDGSLPASRNEVVQLGFRLAKQVGLERVHGLDVPGDFPFDAVQAWAKANGRMGDIQRLMAEGEEETARVSRMQEQGSIGDILRYMNEPESIRRNHSFYPVMLTFGSGADQPGVALLSSWYGRNLAICARLLQALAPGERAVVFYGQGHVYLLNQCLDEAPGVERVDPRSFLSGG